MQQKFNFIILIFLLSLITSCFAPSPKPEEIFVEKAGILAKKLPSMLTYCSAVVFYKETFMLSTPKLDVIKTNSKLTPLEGTIEIPISYTNNRTCSPQGIRLEAVGIDPNGGHYESEQEACSAPACSPQKWQDGKIVLKYGYSNKRWNYLGVKADSEHVSELFIRYLEVATTSTKEQVAQNYNSTEGVEAFTKWVEAFPRNAFEINDLEKPKK